MTHAPVVRAVYGLAAWGPPPDQHPSATMTVTDGVSAIPKTHPFSFHDQKAVVVAGTAGIGLAVAQLFAVLGGKVSAMGTRRTALCQPAQIDNCMHQLHEPLRHLIVRL